MPAGDESQKPPEYGQIVDRADNAFEFFNLAD
jgi:hypothetical protein